MSEVELRRQQAEKRRLRVLGDQKSRLEVIGGKGFTPEDDIPNLYTAGVTAAQETESKKSSEAMWTDFSVVIRAICFVCLLPISLISALVSFRDNRTCWTPDFTEDTHPLVALLLRAAPEGVSPLSLFITLQAFNVSLAEILPRYLRRDGARAASVPSGISSALTLFGLSPHLAAWTGVGLDIFHAGSVFLRILKEFCVYLVLWQVFSVILRCFTH